MSARGSGDVVLVEPGINPITRRVGLPVVANYPPLTQARLAGQIEGGGVEIADLRVPGERRRLLARLHAEPPLLVGISLTFTSNGDMARDIAADIRAAAPGTRIVLGGTAPSEDPESFSDSAVDLIGFRAGDAALAALVKEARKAGRAPDRFPGFFHRKAGGWVLDPATSGPEMAALRPAAWRLLPARYWRTYFQGFRPTGMGQTSEGCPYDCTFCSVWVTHGRRISLASLENVQHDFLSLPSFVRGFFFADDIWMQGSEKQLRQLHDPLLEWLASEFRPRSQDLWLTVETRTDLYLRQEARFREWIRRGGLKWVFFGVEAVTDEQLEDFSKRNTVRTNSEAIRRAAEAGALVTAQFVVPCEADREYFDEVVRFLRGHRRWIRNANFTIATPLPGTELYAQVLASAPELADRTVVSHPAFSLYTALMPTRLDPREFYEQVARLYGAANQVRFSLLGAWGILLSVRRSPWLLPRIARMPGMLRALTSAGTYLRAHRLVQGDRLLAPRAAQPDGLADRAQRQDGRAGPRRSRAGNVMSAWNSSRTAPTVIPTMRNGSSSSQTSG